MHVRLALFAATLMVLAATAPAATGRSGKPGDYTVALRHNGLERRYMVHVPASYDATKPAAVLLVLHGGGGNMEYQANDARYGLISKSDSAGFIAVFPNGTSRMKRGMFATWNAGNCCAHARDANVDDVGFIREVVEDVSRRWNVDRGRIHASGMSNGGLMAYRLACEASDLFTAIAAVAGTDNTRQCSPGHPVSVLHIHAKNDTHVLFNGGAGPDTGNLSAVTDFTSVPATISKWVGLDGCPTVPKRVLDKPGAYCDLYAPCRGDTRVQLCVTESGGHSWPGGTKPRAPEPPSTAIFADDVMWAFFSP